MKKYWSELHGWQVWLGTFIVFFFSLWLNGLYWALLFGGLVGLVGYCLLRSQERHGIH